MKGAKVYSFFPIDRANCECQEMVLEWKEKLATTPPEKRERMVQDIKFVTCPRDTTNMRRYKIVCKNCGETQAFVWATDDTLRDWCDCHYVQWSDGEQWHGCLTPHVSSITEELCFECCCGQDTRDFRANATLSYKTITELENKASIGRKFGKSNSKFKTVLIDKNMIPFS